MEMKDKIVVRGELALVLAVLINSFAVAVTVYAGLGLHKFILVLWKMVGCR